MANYQSVAIFIFFSFFVSSIQLAAAQRLHTSGRWIVDASGQRVKFRCVNWAGHSEVNIPEGLNHQPVDWITDWISSNGFNCVRLTYSIDMALNPDQSVADSFRAAADSTGASPADLNDEFEAAKANNPFLDSATTRSTFAAVITALAARDVMVILDNHVSRASWCCNYDDGNGWWASADGYESKNSRFFDTANWLSGLAAMASFSQQYPNVVGMSLRNELRAVGGQDEDGHRDWYELVTQGAKTIYAGNSDLLVAIGGVQSSTDLSFLRSNPLDVSAWPDRTVWEFHSYYWSNLPFSFLCSGFKAVLGAKQGFLLQQNRPYTGPLWLSEFGAAQFPDNSITGRIEQDYLKCLVEYLEGNDADWAVWAIQGSYYVRDGKVGYDEGYGLLNTKWTDWRNPEFRGRLGSIFNATQGPGFE